ncbi:MAG: MFS transporter [Anaerolineales bacterium]|jgi:MFS family permease
MDRQGNSPDETMEAQENHPKRPGKKLITPVLAWFLITMILANTAARMVFVLLPLYMRDELGASISQVGLTFTLANILPLLLQIFGGWLSDTIGRLRTIAIGAVVATFGYIGFAIAPTWEWIIVALLLEYVSGSLVGPSFGAFIADQSSDENRTKLFGIINSIYQVVGIIGPLLGGYIAYNFGFAPLMTIGATGYGIAAVLRVWMAVSSRFSEKRSAATSKQLSFAEFKRSIGTMVTMVISGGILTWIFITDGVRDISFSLASQLEPLYLADIGQLNEQQIGGLSSISNIAMVLVMAPAGWLAAKISERKTIMLGFFVQFTGFVIFLIAGNFLGFAVSWFTLGIGFALVSPSYDSLISKAVPEENRGLAYGLFWTSVSLLALPAPYLGGILWDRFTPRTPFIITTIVVLLSILPVWFKFKLPDKQAKPRGTNAIVT